MNKFLYQKLAFTNIKKNGKFYFPYILTCIGTISMFYIMCSITFNDGMKKMPGADSLIIIMNLGCIVIGFFSSIFLFYTNSFLMKRRKKELGLYNILGMEKRHIAKIMLFETIITSIISISFGLLFGILFDKLICMILLKILNFSVVIGFQISIIGIFISLMLFCGIFAATLIYNLLRIQLSKPIELLKGGNLGEKEPKTKLIMTFIGTLCLGIGYYIALTTKSPLDALTLFFLAVILVIVGTYFIFTAGSIALLKLFRKNKNYYYKTKHFTSVSGMLYRMKQNAVGLANICILSTMVLVMVATTVSLYIGVQDALNNRFPNDITVTIRNPEDNQREAVLPAIEKAVKYKNGTISNMTEYSYLSFIVNKEDNTFSTDHGNYYSSHDQIRVLYFMTSDEYKKLTGESAILKSNEVLVYSNGEYIGDTFNIFGKKYLITDYLINSPISANYTDIINNVYYIIVSDDTALNAIYQEQLEAYKSDASDLIYHISFDVDGTKEEKIALADTVSDATVKYGSFTESKQKHENSFYTMYGSLLFLGIFLGFLFLMATVLIIYYKQISEGYDDKERFSIMQKVGMSHTEVKSTIKSQVLKVFFIPLVMSVIHIAAAFKMITKLLILLNLTNIPLFLICTIATVLIFAIIYAIVYGMTARVYYRIVE